MKRIFITTICLISILVSSIGMNTYAAPKSTLKKLYNMNPIIASQAIDGVKDGGVSLKCEVYPVDYSDYDKYIFKVRIDASPSSDDKWNVTNIATRILLIDNLYKADDNKSFIDVAYPENGFSNIGIKLGGEIGAEAGSEGAKISSKLNWQLTEPVIFKTLGEKKKTSINRQKSVEWRMGIKNYNDVVGKQVPFIPGLTVIGRNNESIRVVIRVDVTYKSRTFLGIGSQTKVVQLDRCYLMNLKEWKECPRVIVGNDYILTTTQLPILNYGENAQAPAKAFVTDLNGKYNYDSNKKIITATIDKKTIKVDIKNKIAYLNNKKKPFNSPIASIDKSGNPYVSIKLIADCLGYKIRYYNPGKMIMLEK